MKTECQNIRFYERAAEPVSSAGDFAIEMVVLLLMATGTVFVYSAGATLAPDAARLRFYETPMFKQIVFFPLAVGILLLMKRVDYRLFRLQGPLLKSPTFYLVVFSFISLAAVLIFGEERNQSKRWLDLMPGPMYLSFQPSELTKWAMILFVAAYLDKIGEQIQDFKRRFIPVCCIVGLAVGLIVIEDFGTGLFIALLTFLLLWIGGARWWHLLTPLIVAVPGFIAAVMLSPTRLNRIKRFFFFFIRSGGLALSGPAITEGHQCGGVLGDWFGSGSF